jgi:beta-glucosidase
VKSLGNIPYAPRPSPPAIPPEPKQPNETYTAPPGFQSVPAFIYPYLTATPTSTTTPPPATPFPYSPAGGAPGGNPSLYDVLYTTSVTVTNTGQRPGKEVVQLYVVYPSSAGEPPKQLRGFEKLSIDVGESVTVNFDIMRKDLSFWDVVGQNWQLAKGEYGILIGRSSRDIKLQQTFTM